MEGQDEARRRLGRSGLSGTKIVAASFVVLIVALSVACRGGDARTGATASAPAVQSATSARPSPSPSATPTPDPYATPPTDAASATAALEGVLTGSPDLCPERLKSAWHAICASSNVDGDSSTDTVYFIPVGKSISASANPGAVIVRRGATSRFEQFTLEADVDASPIGRLFFSVSERTGDATADIAFITTACTGTTCSTRAHVESWDGTAWRDRGPADAGVANVDAMSFDGAGGESKITMHGGVVTSPGAGPTRSSTTTYHLVSGRYQLESVVAAPPVYLYHAIADADALFLAGDFARASKSYKDAIANAGLKDWKTENGDAPGRPFLTGYALFRIALATAAQGQDANPAIDDVIAHSPDALFAYAAERFRAGFQENSSVHGGCIAATTYLALTTADGDNPAHIRDGFFYGHANPMRTPADICPL